MQNKENIFVPLTTVNGYAPDELHKIVADRKIIVWGCGHAGRLVKRQLEKMGLTVYAFCDSQASGEFEEKFIISPPEALAASRGHTVFIFIASVKFRLEMQEKCLSYGLIRGVDFDTYFKIRRPEAVISVSGNCNLQCPSCPVRGNSFDIAPKYMTLEMFKKIFNKLLREEPLLTQIDLSLWGEPFFNPDLPQIIQYSESAGIPVILSTALPSAGNLEKIILARPSQLTVSVAGGTKEKYEKYFPGANWEEFLKNFAALKDIADALDFSNRIVVSYHYYSDNMEDDFTNISKLCKLYSLKLHTTLGFPCEYDRLLTYCCSEKYSLADTMKDDLIWDLDKALQFSLEEKEKPCRCQRIFPIINWNGTAALCHTFYSPEISDDFMSCSLKDLIELRHSCDFCKQCQFYGLHRLDPEVQIHQKNGISLMKRGAAIQ